VAEHLSPGRLGCRRSASADAVLLRILKRDPQVAAGPIALAASDMLTLLLYFNFDRWLLA
jgi:hypothetical protein